MTKRLLIWAAVIGVGLIGYVVKSAYHIDDYTIWLAVIMIGLIATVFYFDSRLDALEGTVIHKDYSNIKRQIEEGERHRPQHNRPTSLLDGGAFESTITAAHQVIFDDFTWFGAALNRHISDPWAVEEINDTAVRDFEGPAAGRRYRVYFNACRMGTMQVTTGGHEWIFRPEDFSKNRQARVEVNLDYLRFVPYDDALSLISTVALFTAAFPRRDQSEKEGDAETDVARTKASAVATAALTAHLWESVRVPDVALEFEFQTEGPYEFLRTLTDHWKARGLDPFEKWGGDRSRDHAR